MPPVVIFSTASDLEARVVMALLARHGFDSFRTTGNTLTILPMAVNILGPLRLAVAFIWLATGIISAFVYPEAESRALMAQVGLTGAPATVALYGASYGALGVGLATALGYRVRLMGTIELALIFVFTALLTVGIPELWIHPFGPLTKNSPLIGATVVMMALEE